MRKILFYVMQEEKVCFLHALMNAQQLQDNGYEIKLIFEGKAVKWPAALAEQNNQLYQQAKEKGILAGICQGCARMLQVYEASVKTGLPMLSEMSGHAGMKPFIDDGYEVILA